MIIYRCMNKHCTRYGQRTEPRCNGRIMAGRVECTVPAVKDYA